MNDELLTLGEKIKQIRSAKGFTQTELAKRTGYAQNYISQIESGKSNPSIKVIKKIAKALNIKEVDIFDGKPVLSLSHPDLYKHYDDETKAFLINEKHAPLVVWVKELVEEGIIPTNEEKKAIKTILKSRIKSKH